jgi:hypothetical protein
VVGSTGGCWTAWRWGWTGWRASVAAGVRSQDSQRGSQERQAEGVEGVEGVGGVEGEVELATRALGLEARRRAGEGSVLVTMDVRDPSLENGLDLDHEGQPKIPTPCPVLSCPPPCPLCLPCPTLALCLCRLGSGNCSLGRCHSSLEESSRGGMHAAPAARQTTTARRPQGSLAFWPLALALWPSRGRWRRGVRVCCAGVLVCGCAGPGR